MPQGIDNIVLSIPLVKHTQPSDQATLSMTISSIPISYGRNCVRLCAAFKNSSVDLPNIDFARKADRPWKMSQIHQHQYPD